ncbi:MAG TPA: glycosyltransferase family 39 protein [Thermoanaerobaculia bacterium]|nr:glycosyltransferase family 39 protein [Thermoanaerobaculia bacterium]
MTRARQPVSRGEWLALGGIVLLFSFLRFPLFREPGVRLGWHSDAAVFGLMARDIYEGTFHLFWWGQSYMGTLTSMFGALGGLIVAPFGVTPPVGPLGMRVGTAIEWLAMIAFFWLVFRIAFGPAVAIIVALLLTMGPDWFFHSQLAPRGGEMLLFLSGAILLVAAGGLRRRRDWFLFGLLCGIGWWMHQGIAFAAGAALLVVILRSEAWEIVRLPRREYAWRRAAFPTRLLIRSIDVVLLVLLALAVVREFIPRVPAFFLHSAVREALTAWLLFRLVLALSHDGPLRDALAHLWRERRVWMPPAALFAAGALIGYTPVIIGAMRGLYEGTYGFSAPLRHLGDVPAQMARVLRSDLWRLIGASWTPAGVVIGGVLLVLLAAHLIRHRDQVRAFLTGRPGDYGLRGVIGATLLLCAAFYFGSSRAYGGAVRYIAPAVPILFGFAVAEAAQWWGSGRRLLRGAAAAAVVALALAYAMQTLRLAGELESAQAEGRFYTGAVLAAGPSFDPRPAMEAIERGGYGVCYAEFAVGVNLEWLLDRRVRFISWNSVEPRRALAPRLAALPVPKCFVDWDGSVRPWDPREHDDSIGRTAAERLRRRR